MLITRLAYFLTLALLTLPNRAEPSTTSDGIPLLADVAPVRQADLTLALGDATPLDDEVEIPDEDEDDDPDDLGQALGSDDETYPPSAPADAAHFERYPSTTPPRLCARDSSEWTYPRCSGLSRLRC